MAYVRPNCKSKAEIKRRLKAGETITVFQPGLGTVPRDGTIDIEGPHYPQPHKWWGTATIVDGKVTKVR